MYPKYVCMHNNNSYKTISIGLYTSNIDLEQPQEHINANNQMQYYRVAVPCHAYAISRFTEGKLKIKVLFNLYHAQGPGMNHKNYNIILLQLDLYTSALIFLNRIHHSSSSGSNEGRSGEHVCHQNSHHNKIPMAPSLITDKQPGQPPCRNRTQGLQVQLPVP